MFASSSHVPSGRTPPHGPLRTLFGQFIKQAMPVKHSEQAPQLPHWQEAIYAAMARNAIHVSDFYKLPLDATVEIGRQIAI